MPVEGIEQDRMELSLTNIHLPSVPGVAAQLQPAGIAADCRHYRGDRPCLHNRLCAGCGHYAPYSHRICIIKLGALGDVIRTLCLLPEIRRRWPGAQVTWVTRANAKRMIQHHPEIDRVIALDAGAARALTHEHFDLVISLDKEAEPCGLAMSLNAEAKLGVGWSTFGTPVPLNPQARHYFQLGLSDELKFNRNTKGYPQLVYEALGWHYAGQPYDLPVDEAAAHAVRRMLRARGWDEQASTLGINVGAGRAFANKMWPTTRIVEIIRGLQQRHPATQMLLLGGPEERPIVTAILASLGEASPASRGVIDAGTDHDEPHFVALVDCCDALLSGDTMAMHVAIARRKPVAVFFGPTCAQEIDLYGRGVKLVSQAPCAPCYKRVCDHSNACTEDIPLDQILTAVDSLLVPRQSASYALPILPKRLAG